MPRKKAETEKPKKEKQDARTMTCNLAEISSILGMTTAGFTSLVQAGTIPPKDAKGRYNLKETVNAYVKSLKQKQERGSRTELELEQIALKNEKIKEQLKSWRMARDVNVGAEIIRQLNALLNRMKTLCESHADVIAVIDDLAKATNAIDVEGISYIIEGEEEEDV